MNILTTFIIKNIKQYKIQNLQTSQTIMKKKQQPFIPTIEISSTKNHLSTPKNYNHSNYKSPNPSQKRSIDNIQQSQIAQQQICHQQIFQKRQSKISSYRQNQPLIHHKDINNQFSSFFKHDNHQVNNLNGYSNNQENTFLIGNMENKKSKLVSMKDLRRYEQNSKKQYEARPNNAKQMFQPFQLKVSQVNHKRNDSKGSIKKSQSSGKLDKLRNGTTSNQKNNQHELKYDSILFHNQSQEIHPFRHSLDQYQINKLSQANSPHKVTQKQFKNNKYHIISPTITPKTVPFSCKNINTSIPRFQQLQQLQVNSINSSFHKQRESQNYNSNQYLRQLKKNKISISNINKKQNYIYKQLNSRKYYFDVPLDINEYQYQLDIQCKLQKNRGFQLCLISAEDRVDKNVIARQYGEIQHFKFEIIKMPPNILRLRIYLLIDIISPNTQQEPKHQPNKLFLSRQQKIWKQIHLPLVSPNQIKRSQQQNSSSHINNKKQNNSFNIIKISLFYHSLSQVRIKLIDLIDFNLTLNHSLSPLAYFCIEPDYNGAEFVSFKLSGKQTMRVSDQFISSDGCQGKCQLI